MGLDIKQIYYICVFYCITFLSWTHYVGLFNHYQRACYLRHIPSVQQRLDFFLPRLRQRHIFCVCLQRNTPYNYSPIRFIAVIYFTTCVASMCIDAVYTLVHMISSDCEVLVTQCAEANTSSGARARCESGAEAWTRTEHILHPSSLT